MPAKRLARRIDAEARAAPHRMRHQAFAARLVDRPAARLDDDDLQSGAGAVDRGGQPGRAAARDEQVDHRQPRQRGVLDRIRVRQQRGVEHREHRAVTHAVCTSGSATPSTTTAT